MKIVIVSDLHLGAPNSRTKAFLKFLANPPDKLIINGDLVDSLNLKRFDEDDWDVIHRLRELTADERLVFIRGNHDYDPDVPSSSTVVPLLIGTSEIKSMHQMIGTKRYYITHGDRFDSFLRWKLVTRIADWFYYQMQRTRIPTVWIKHVTKKLTGTAKSVKTRGVAYADMIGCDGVILGHSHFPDDSYVDGIHYLNSGSWTEPKCNYIMIDDDYVTLCRWPEDHKDPYRV